MKDRAFGLFILFYLTVGIVYASTTANTTASPVDTTDGSNSSVATTPTPSTAEPTTVVTTGPTTVNTTGPITATTTGLTTATTTGLTTATTTVPTTTPSISLGDNCTEDANCNNTISNAACKNNVCACPDGTFKDGNSCPLGTAYKIIKLTKRSAESDAVVASFGENCTVASNKSCDQHANLFCDNSTHRCMCTTDHFWNGSTCVSVKELKPDNLVVTRLDVHSIDISWNRPNVGNDLDLTYKVMWSSRNGTDNNSSNELTSQLQFSIPVNQPGDLYDITVTTILKSQNTSASDMRTQRSVPPAPTGIMAVNTSVSSITVRWNFTGIVDGFNGSLVSSKQSKTFNELKTETLKNFTGLEAGTKYNFSITAYSGNTSLQNDSTQYSEEVTAVFRTVVDVPEVPSSVNLVDVSKTSISLTVGTPGKPNGEIIGYLFQISSRVYDDLPFTDTTVEFRNLSSNYSFSGLTPGTFYKFLVSAVNEGFNGTAALNKTSRTNESEPGVVYISDTQPTADDVRLMWNRPEQPNGDIIGYRIYINNTQNNTDCVEVILSTTNNQSIPYSNCAAASSGNVTKNQLFVQQDVKALTPSQTYSAHITALTIAGEGDPAVTTFMTVIAVPDKVTNVMGTAVSPTSILVSWTKPRIRPGPTTYNVTTYDVIDDKNISNTCTSKDFDITQCTVNDLEEYWQYKFYVTISTLAGSNTTRIENIVTTLPARPGSVQDVATKGYNFGADNCIDTKIDIEWREPNQRDRNSKIIGYDIYEQGLGNNLQQKEAYPGFDTYRKHNEQFKVTIQGLQPDVSYSFKIRAEIQNRTLKTWFIVSSKIVYTIEKCPLTTPMVILIVLVVLFLLCAIALVSYVCYTKRRYVGRRQSNRAGEFIGPGVDDDEDIPEERPLVISLTRETVEEMHRNDDLLFRTEYEDLKKISPKYSVDAANLDENKAKNRYYNILPFDHSRVKLVAVDDDPASDYINANYIPGYNSEREYIAAQGPLPGTAADFWRMVWEQNVSIIVMLTKCSENHQEKCAQYWPDEVNEPKQYGDIVVNPTSISNLDKYNITVFNVSLGDNTRVIKHFHFLEWPDFSAKVEPNDMIEFITLVRGHMTPDKKGPAIIHCSAGVGRTGTYITVDYLIQFVRDNPLDEEVDLFAWVLQMRQYRTNMVQVVKQYAFIHDALVELIERKERQMHDHEDDGLLYVNQTYENKAFDDSEDLYENTKVGEQPQTEL